MSQQSKNPEQRELIRASITTKKGLVMSENILDDYETFVQGKRRSEVATGHKPGDLNENLFDFQHAIVSWAVRRGRAAIFADTGIGSEGYCAVKMGRKFIGTELKPQYWELACQNIADAERAQVGLFSDETA